MYIRCVSTHRAESLFHNGRYATITIAIKPHTIKEIYIYIYAISNLWQISQGIIQILRHRNNFVCDVLWKNKINICLCEKCVWERERGGGGRENIVSMLTYSSLMHYSIRIHGQNVCCHIESTDFKYRIKRQFLQYVSHMNRLKEMYIYVYVYFLQNNDYKFENSRNEFSSSSFFCLYTDNIFYKIFFFIYIYVNDSSRSNFFDKGNCLQK